MKKKLLGVVLAVFILCLSVGCDYTDVITRNKAVAESVQDEFVETEKGVGFTEVARSAEGHYTVFRERLTDFMYIGYDRNDTSEYDTLTGVAPLFDPENGLPLTWERYKSLID